MLSRYTVDPEQPYLKCALCNMSAESAAKSAMETGKTGNPTRSSALSYHFQGLGVLGPGFRV